MVYKVGDVLIKTHNTRIFSHPSAMGRMWRINKSNILFVSQLSHSDDAMETIFLFTSEHSNVQVSSPFGGNSLFLTGTDYTIFRFHQISFRLNMKLCHRDGATRRSWVGGRKKFCRKQVLHHVPLHTNFFLTNFLSVIKSIWRCARNHSF